MSIYTYTDEEIMNKWFKNHIATLEQHGNLQVLKWNKPGTSIYNIRYVFDSNKLYISGDLGEAVFHFSSKIYPNNFEDLYLDYFYNKMTAYHEDRMDFNQDKAIDRLEEWGSAINDDDDELINELKDAAAYCLNKDGWILVIEEHHNEICDIDQDYWEWLPNIGDEIPVRIKAYLIGLKMAIKQLEEDCELK